MFKSKSQNKQNTEQTVDKKALLFGLMSVFLVGIGFTIIAPVVPFLVQPYTNSENQAIVVTLLTSVYALCVFFSAPGLGALSDRYGRRPILLVCLLGSAIGYTVFGIGGALWVLFAGRILEGITGGDISTIFAYFADITPKEQRTKIFGWVSAITGIGTAIGPTLGGLIADRFGYAAPMFFGAGITLLNVVFGFFFMPESLNKDNRLKEIPLVRLNPFTQLINVLSMKHVGRILISAFLIWVPNGSLQAIFSQFSIDTFNWKPALIGLMFSIIGIQDIISQSFIMPKLLQKLNDKQIAMLGMASEIIGYCFIAASALTAFYPLFIAGMFVFGFGDSIFGPSFNGMVSKSVDSSEQGRIQGGSQSIQSLARIIGPIIGGQIYISLGSAAPAFMGIILISAAIPVLYKSTHK
ncbi:MFS transporter [Anaerocolumna sp. AGMB13025]|uniref:MFS transporter n=1 Tax=Anaerocolumna sp. AGMB13025 TaxID=3039116 RepID=UPI00241CDF76|nr:MFS transporter [Anaerocolumna sp. AGMB13025]WFR57307.1 MFS transporter [Anaerocolumna sp. AGMB13025]